MPRGVTGRQHGTRSMYTAGCRMDCCRSASTKAQKKRRLREVQEGALLMPAVGVVRRLHALRAIGWRLQDIADSLDVSTGALSSLLYKNRDQTHVTRSLYTRVLATYDRMSATPGPSPMTRDRALKAGFAPPLAWDDDTIDDPNAEPVGVWDGERESLDLDEWLFLVRAGELPERAAERCGVQLTTVDRLARRHGRAAEYVAALHYHERAVA